MANRRTGMGMTPEQSKGGSQAAARGGTEKKEEVRKEKRGKQEAYCGKVGVPWVGQVGLQRLDGRLHDNAHRSQRK